ncbi:hypothetical protein QBC37DRAFT_33566 [Rhypophila decipiens]|uniref:Uncharacterized protein n=1 Tax=Rhypophila decipiens TaxID=261697 RepID=A0AAN6YJJ1_9PEZI|nr:hypothetical protein QBC37DRAFT_33566 [Rhypophila decipiens]
MSCGIGVKSVFGYIVIISHWIGVPDTGLSCLFNASIHNGRRDDGRTNRTLCPDDSFIHFVGWDKWRMDNLVFFICCLCFLILYRGQNRTAIRYDTGIGTWGNTVDFLGFSDLLILRELMGGKHCWDFKKEEDDCSQQLCLMAF